MSNVEDLIEAATSSETRDIIRSVDPSQLEQPLLSFVIGLQSAIDELDELSSVVVPKAIVDIHDDSKLKQAEKVVNECHAFVKQVQAAEIDAYRSAFHKAWKRAKKMQSDVYAAAEAAKQDTKKAINEYLTKQHQRNIEKQRTEEEECRSTVIAGLQNLIEQTDDPEEKQRIAAQIDKIDSFIENREISAPKTDGVGTKLEHTYEVVDFSKIKREYLCEDIGLIADAVDKYHKAAEEMVGGIVVHEVVNTRVKGVR